MSAGDGGGDGAEFGAGATLEITVPERSLRDARQQIEAGIPDPALDVHVSDQSLRAGRDLVENTIGREVTVDVAPEPDAGGLETGAGATLGGGAGAALADGAGGGLDTVAGRLDDATGFLEETVEQDEYRNRLLEDLVDCICGGAGSGRFRPPRGGGGGGGGGRLLRRVLEVAGGAAVLGGAAAAVQETTDDSPGPDDPPGASPPVGTGEPVDEPVVPPVPFRTAPRTGTPTGRRLPLPDVPGVPQPDTLPFPFPRDVPVPDPGVGPLPIGEPGGEGDPVVSPDRDVPLDRDRNPNEVPFPGGVPDEVPEEPITPPTPDGPGQPTPGPIAVRGTRFMPFRNPGATGGGLPLRAPGAGGDPAAGPLGGVPDGLPLELPTAVPDDLPALAGSAGRELAAAGTSGPASPLFATAAGIGAESAVENPKLTAALALGGPAVGALGGASAATSAAAAGGIGITAASRLGGGRARGFPGAAPPGTERDAGTDTRGQLDVNLSVDTSNILRNIRSELERAVRPVVQDAVQREIEKQVSGGGGGARVR